MKQIIWNLVLRAHYKIQRGIGRLVYFLNRNLGFPKLSLYCPACDRDVWAWRPLHRDVGHGKFMIEPIGRMCPHCRTLERTRHFAIYMKQHGILESCPRVLHFAPESSLETLFRTKLGEKYVTTDLFMAGVDRKEDITKMTFDSDSFDFIYCSNVLEHIEDDHAAMSELFRVLAPGGWAIIQVPIKGATTYEDANITDSHERYLHFGQGDHVRYYGEDIKARLEKVGFMVEPFYMPDILGLSAKEIGRMNLGKRELIQKCSKPA